MALKRLQLLFPSTSRWQGGGQCRQEGFRSSARDNLIEGCACCRDVKVTVTGNFGHSHGDCDCHGDCVTVTKLSLLRHIIPGYLPKLLNSRQCSWHCCISLLNFLLVLLITLLILIISNIEDIRPPKPIYRSLITISNCLYYLIGIIGKALEELSYSFSYLIACFRRYRNLYILASLLNLI